MKYHSALRYLYSLVDYEKRRIERYAPNVFKLDRVRTYLERLGNPQERYPALHIAGTKGKGSVSAMLASILLAAERRNRPAPRIGLYTSPHLHTYRERIQINGVPIARAEMAALVEEIAPIIESVPDLTMFEATTGLAFLYFARQQVDWAVIEVGLGGRLDATNVITPQVSVITSISLDHTYLLGDTVEQIAAEKGGIIKPEVPVVVAPQQKAGALEVLRAIAAERRSPFLAVEAQWRWEPLRLSVQGQRVRLRRRAGSSPLEGDYLVPLIGDFQQENAATAVAAAEVLREAGYPAMEREAVAEGLRQTRWPGRMEVLSRDPLLLVDCAHNPYSARVLARSLRTWFPDRNWVLIYGASNDKDMEGMLEHLLPMARRVIVTRSHHPRAASPSRLADFCAGLGCGAEIAIHPQRALELAQRHLRYHPDWGILVTGSIFLVADVRTAWSKDHPLPLPREDWDDEPWVQPTSRYEH